MPTASSGSGLARADVIAQGWLSAACEIAPGPSIGARTDARDILAELTARNVRLSLGGSIHDPNDPVGRLLFNVLAMVAEFEADLIRMRTREGMNVARAEGTLERKAAQALRQPGRPPRANSPTSAPYSTAEMAELYQVSAAAPSTEP